MSAPLGDGRTLAPRSVAGAMMTNFTMTITSVLGLMPAGHAGGFIVRFRTADDDVLTLDLPNAALAELTAGLLSPPVGINFYPSLLRALADGIESWAKAPRGS
jgi:hypothetical protein